MEEFLYTDSESLYSKLKHQEKQLRLKRRWLMGLALSDSEQEQVTSVKFHDKKNIPESFLREDDVYYETIKASVKKGFGALNCEIEYHADQDNVRTFDLPSDLKELFSMLDAMSNNGLQVLSELLTGSAIKFDKTRSKMKKIIKERLPEVVRKWEDVYKIKIAAHLSRIFKNPQNFRLNFAELSSPASKPGIIAALKVLDGLEDMHFLTLSAMHRKLRGIQGYVPHLQPKRSGWGRSILIGQLRKICMKMLSDIGEEDELQEPLAKAMAVGTLSLKLTQGCPFVAEFRQFSPDIVTLQNQIANAIWLLNKKVTFPELKNLQMLLDPNAELSNRSLRTAVKNLLTEYLFECSDMDIVPEILLETISTINRTCGSVPYRFSSQEEIEEEVENVLSVSAQVKQILWDVLPEYEFDLDFADAYMEDLEDTDYSHDSDDNDSVDNQEVSFGKGNIFHSNDLHEKIETTGETNPANSNDFSGIVEPQNYREGKLIDSSVSASSSTCSLDNNEKHQLLQMQGVMSSEPSDPSSVTMRNHIDRQEHTVEPVELPDFVSSNFSPEGYSDGEGYSNDKAGVNRNQYLAIQEACDKTSLVAYHLIGCVLEEFAHLEGLDFDWADASYLRGDNSSRTASGAAKEEHISYEAGAYGSVIVQVLEDLLPSYPESGKQKVKQLMGLK